MSIERSIPMSVAIVIPARLHSSRLPKKMLLNKTGWPLIRHTYEQAKKVKLAQRVIIATDDEEILRVVKNFGGEVVMTDPQHPTGTDRLAEVVAKYLQDADYIVNIQGDEPELAPENIDTLIRIFQASDAAMGTLVSRFGADNKLGPGSPLDPHCVKAVLGSPIVDSLNAHLGYQVLYFSRSLIPFPRDNNGIIENPTDYFCHLGVYIYRPDFLQHYVTLPQGRLELVEKLEQLRILENNFKIVAGVVSETAPGIDTQADYDNFISRYKQKETVKKTLVQTT